MLALLNGIPTLDRVLDDVMKDFSTSARFTPAVDIRSNENEIAFSIDVPGVKESDLELTVEKGVLRVSGKRAGRGEFALAYTLPDTVDDEKLAAELADGVLTIRVPKLPKAQPRKIQIGRADKQLGT